MKKRMKRSLSFLLTLAMLFSLSAGLVVGVAAEDSTDSNPSTDIIDSGACGPNATYEYYDETPGDQKPSGVLTIKGVGPMTDYEKTTAQSANTPWLNKDYALDIREVVIMPGITTVGSFAFFNLTNCTSVTIPVGVISIGEWAFAYTALTRVDLPVTMQSIRHFAFYKSALLTDGANSTCAGYPAVDDTKLGSSSTNYELMNDLDLASRDNVTVEAYGELGNGISWRYSSGSKTLTLSSAYDGSIDTRIREMVDLIPTTENPNPWPWNDYKIFIEKVYITKGISNVGQYVLADLPVLKSVTIGEHVATIEAYAFQNALSLKTTVNLPESTTAIEDNAFVGCPGPVTVVTPNTRAEVGATFSTVGNTGVVYEFATPAGGSTEAPTTGFLANDTIKWTYIAGAGLLMVEPAVAGTQVAMPDFTNSSEAPWQSFSDGVKTLLIQPGITEIGRYNFADLSKLSVVSFPADGLAYIRNGAFQNDASISSIAFPASLLRIYEYAFDGCNGLTSATRKNSFMLLDRTGNERLWSLIYGGGSVTPPPSTETVSGTCGDSATWTYDPSTKTLTISGTGAMKNYVSGMETPWFLYLEQIETLVVTEGITTVGNHALSNAISLKYVTLPATLAGVGMNAFNNCPAIVYAYVDREQGTVALLSGNTDLESKLTYKAAASLPTSGSCGNSVNWSYSTTSKTLTISGSGPMYDYSDVSATPWYSCLADIAYVVVTEGVTTVGNNALNGASNLRTVTLPSTLTTVGTNAFSSCVLLYDAYVDRTVGTVNVQSGNIYLTEVLRYKASTPVNPNPGSGSEVNGSIGASLTWTYTPATHALNIQGTGEIPNYASASQAPWAAYAADITAITVQEGITRIGNYAFAGMTNVIDIYLPQSLRAIGDNAFNGCSSAKKIKLPDDLTTIGKGAFRGCSSLKSIEIPGGVRVIDDYTFSDCVALESVTLNKGLERIGYRAFYNCKALKFVEFPSTLSQIDDEAFWGCSSLEGVVISSPLLDVGNNAFAGCTSLVKVILNGVGEPTVGYGNENLTDHYVASSATGTLSNGVMWKVDRVDGTLTFFGNGEVLREESWLAEMKYVDTVIFDSGITGIAAGLLKDESRVKRIQMASTVIVIGDGAFERCQNLASVILSKQLKSLGQNAFAGCTALSYIELPDFLTVISDGVFTSCTALQTVKLGSNVTVIGKNAFDNCVSLREIELPATLKTLSEGAFRDCRSLTKVTLSNGKLPPLQKGIFAGCSNIQTVKFNGTKEQWNVLSANADEELKSATVEFTVTWTVNFVYKGGPNNGQMVSEPVKYTGKEGERFTIVIPNVPFYTPSATVMEYTFGAADQEIAVYYLPNEYTVTIEYVDANGNKLAEDGSAFLTYGDTATLIAQPIKGYTVRISQMVVNVEKGNHTVQFVYDINSYLYKIEYWNSRTEKLISFDLKAAEYLTSVTLTSSDMPFIQGYVLTDLDATYVIDSVQGDSHVIKVYYDPTIVDLTIEYVNDKGEKVAEDKKLTIYYGDAVSVESPVVTGMKPAAPVQFDAYNGQGPVITVEYEREEYNITIHFVKDSLTGEQVYEPCTIKARYEDKFVFDLAEYEQYAPMVGYEAKEPVLTIDSVTEDAELTVVYTIRKLTVTIHYADEQGNKLAEDVTITCDWGTKITQATPAINGWIPEAEEFVVDAVTENVEKTITYERRSYNITVNFVKDSVTGEKVHESYTITAKFEDKFVFDLSEFAEYAPETGYEVKEPVLTIDSVTEDEELTIVYTIRKMTVIIHYVDDQGNKLAEDVTITCDWGTKITQTSPVINGWVAEIEEYMVDAVTENIEKTIAYERRSYNITVNFVKDSLTGEQVYESYTTTAKFESTFTFDLSQFAQFAPMTGYEVKEPVLTIDSVTEDEELTIVYTIRKMTVTIHYVDENGKKVAEDFVATYDYGTKVTHASPDVKGMTPDLAVYIKDSLTEDVEVTVPYTRRSYQITVQFVEQGTENYKIFSDFTTTVKFGDSYTFVLADNVDYIHPYYEAESATLDFGVVEGDMTLALAYSPKQLKLTVEYKNAEGTVVATDELTVLAGRSYEIPAKTLTGYKPTEVVKGEMGVEDVKVAITLVADETQNGGNESGDENGNNGNNNNNNNNNENNNNNNENNGGKDDESKGNGGKAAAVIIIILVVLGGGGAAFYFLYMKKKY